MIKQGRVHKKCIEIAYVFKMILHFMIVWKGMICADIYKQIFKSYYQLLFIFFFHQKMHPFSSTYNMQH